MVGIVIVSHSAKIAEGVVELARQMGGGDVAVAAAGGTGDPHDPIGTDAFRVKAAIEEVWSEDGVLVLMDLGSALMSTETALDFLEEPADAERVHLCEAPLVEGAVAAVATARIGGSLDDVATEARDALMAKAEHLGIHPAADTPIAVVSEHADRIQITVPNRLGLHMRPAGRLVETAGGYEAQVSIMNLTTGLGPVSARSLSRVSALGVRQGHVIEVRAQGPQAAAVLTAISDLAADNFGDRDDATEPSRPTSPPPPATAGQITGVGASPGVAVGPARHLVRAVLDVPDRTPDAPEIEWSRLLRALSDARIEVERQRTVARERAGSDQAAIFDAHLLILHDDALQEAAAEAVAGAKTAEEAWLEAAADAAAGIRRLEDAYQAERAADIDAVASLVLARLLGVEARSEMSGAGVLVASDLTPGETATLDREVVKGIVTAAGGATSHSAIIARALGVPAVVATGPIEVAEGTVLLVDGSAGTVTIDPDQAEIEAARERSRREAEAAREARSAASSPAVTLDGVVIEVAANIGSSPDAREAMAMGADGVGLLRTEFLFIDRSQPPSESEQEEAYRDIARTLDGRPLLLRTLDVGGDKPLPFVARPREDNPFLGVRGLRLGLARPELLLSQLRAALRTAADHPMRIMFPMVATMDDWDRARSLVAQAAADVGGLPDGLELGVMVEVPSVPLVAARFAEVVDFFSVGTNDLTQYALAAERGNPDLAAMSDGLHPAVLRLIDFTCRAAAQHGRWVGVCGELAGEPAAIPVLIGLGVTELSMNPIAIPRAKQAVRSLDTAFARSLAEEALAQGSAADVRRLVATRTG